MQTVRIRLLYSLHRRQRSQNGICRDRTSEKIMVRGLVIQKIGWSARGSMFSAVLPPDTRNRNTCLFPSIGWAGRDSGQSRFTCMPRTRRKSERSRVDHTAESDSPVDCITASLVSVTVQDHLTLCPHLEKALKKDRKLEQQRVPTARACLVTLGVANIGYNHSYATTFLHFHYYTKSRDS